MTEGELLLTDEFIQFSEAIKTLYQEKKTLKEEFKKVYEDFQTKIKDIDTRASKLAEEFNKGKVTPEPSALATVTSQNKKK